LDYKETKPSPAAGRFVKCFWYLADDSPASAAQRIVPDGCCELILNLGRPFESFETGRWNLQPQAFLVGQITSPMMIRPSGSTMTFGVRFHPYGAARLFSLPMHEITNSVLALDDLSQHLIRHLECIGDGRSVSERFALLDQCIMALASKSAQKDLLVAHAVKHFECSGGLASIAHLAASAGISTRQFERRFRDAVGISPKLFCRMQRFQSVFTRMDESALNWADAAVQSGYYDQAHLIRDFREFAGKTPTALLSSEIDLARLFASAAKMSHFSNPMIRPA
jgi:AraC-like DNA-binding protein